MDIDKLRRELDAWSKDDIVPGDLAALCAEASAALARLRAVRDFNSHPKAPDPDSAVHRAMELKLEAAEAELAGLRDLFRLDEEQHANHIKELTKAHEARITKYADELARQRTRAEEAEAELARLREPAGDVGEVVAGLKDRVGDRKWMVDLDRDAADLLLRQAGEIERWRGLRDAIAELRGYGPEWPEHGNVPLAIAAGYSLTLTRATSAENRLREAAEVAAKAVMKFKHIKRGRYYPGYHEDMRDFVRKAVLAKPEPAPTPENVRNFNSHLNAPDQDSAVFRAMELKLEAAEVLLRGAGEVIRSCHDAYASDGDGKPPTFGRPRIKKTWDAASAFLAKLEKTDATK